jgi:predicted kinase
MTPPTLYIFAGLPATGKTTLSQRLARHLGAMHLRIDTLEQALRDLCHLDVQAEGYALAHRLAAENLALGLSVIADSCNPLDLTREAWEATAHRAHARPINIEITCTNPTEHRHRAESRRPTIPNHTIPTWPEIENREYAPWTRERILIDTAGKTEAESFAELLSKLPSVQRT